MPDLSFAATFGITVLVGACCHATFGLIGIVVAFLSPGSFRTGVVPAQTPAQALGVVISLLVAALVANLVVAAIGSAAFIGVRRLIANHRE